MIRAERFCPEDIRKIQRACCHVFLNEEALRSVDILRNNTRIISYPFLEKLSFEEIRKAYRMNVMAYHPDRHQGKEPEERESLARYLEGINRSYEYLCAIFGKRKLPEEGYAGRGKIIAVGGAKGGIGKSVFAANLGMLLASCGFRTVLVDLDLGGSDLHIYLGHKNMPEVTISDFLHRKVQRLEGTMIVNGSGPTLIAGNNSELGAANIPFQRKMRLIDSIRKMNADYVVLDLGGGTDYNTLDFFLEADHGIVLTTLDQPSYVEAYAFIKTALQRKLARLFGSDSHFPGRKDFRLKEIVLDALKPSEEGNPRTISQLLEEVAREDRLNLPLVADEILGFSPGLVINRCIDERAALRVADSLRTVARQRLSIELTHIGSISRHPVIEQSTSYMHHPLVQRDRTGAFVHEMQTIIGSLSLAD